MRIEPLTVKDKLGRTVVFRAAMPEDAADIIQYLKVTSGETPYLIREPDEITMTLEKEEAFIRDKLDSERELMLAAFVDGKYALYTRPQDGFINAGSGGGIGWALVDDMTHAEVKEEKIIDYRYYHTIKEVKNGEGPHPVKTSKGWLHLAHGVRACAAGLRYVLYMYMTALDDPTKLIAAPGGYFMAPVGEERIGDVSNVLFTNGWIADEDGKVFIYYASSDTRMHVATSTVDKLVDYCMNTPADGLSSFASVETLKKLIDKNLKIWRH